MRRSLGALAVMLVASACGGGAEQPPPTPPTGGLAASVASYDLGVGLDNRFLLGVLTDDNRFVSGGAVRVSLSYLGERGDAPPEAVTETTASFMPLPGEEDHDHSTTTAGPASEGKGVYVARDLEFDRAGVWEAEVTATVDGQELSGVTAFTVSEEPLYPAPGDRAPRTENLTVDSEDAPEEAVDSRAATEGEIPDPELHRATIAGALEDGRPVLAVFSTPVYCVSQFCGPVTDLIAELERDYADRAAFVHVEVWRDFQNRVVNKAAAEWILLGDIENSPEDVTLTEPWVYLIGGDGRIVARWDNVATREEIEPLLRELPAA